MLAAVADRDIDARAVEIGILMGGLDPQRQSGIAPLEIRQRRDQHGAGEKRQRADPEFAAASRRCRSISRPASCSAASATETFAEIALAVGGQPHRARAANEQLDAELFLQPANLVADRRRAERQIARGAAEAQLRGGALEGEQRGQRRDRPQRHVRRPIDEFCSSQVTKSLLLWHYRHPYCTDTQYCSSQGNAPWRSSNRSAPRNHWQPSALAAGPFAGLQGGAVASLLTAEVEALAERAKWGTAISAPAWFLRPTPMADLANASSAVLTEGGRVSVIDNTLWPVGEEQPCATVRVTLSRERAVEMPGFAEPTEALDPTRFPVRTRQAGHGRPMVHGRHGGAARATASPGSASTIASSTAPARCPLCLGPADWTHGIAPAVPECRGRSQPEPDGPAVPAAAGRMGRRSRRNAVAARRRLGAGSGTCWTCMARSAASRCRSSWCRFRSRGEPPPRPQPAATKRLIPSAFRGSSTFLSCAGPSQLSRPDDV